MIKYGNNVMLWMGAFLVFLIDQCSKVWATTLLIFDEEVKMNRFISLHRIYNDSFIMANFDVYHSSETFSLSAPWQFKLLYAACSLILTLGIIWVTNQPALKENSWAAEFGKTGLFLILGGILGNLFDRIFRENGVVDFIRLNAFSSMEPIMNVADIVIYLGEFCIFSAWLIIIVSEVMKKTVKKYALK